MPQGWAIMAIVIALEAAVISNRLNGTWFSLRTSRVVALANVVSGAVGILASLAFTGGWWLVVWIPWVGKNEVDLNQDIKLLVGYYAIAFVLSIVIEGGLEHLLLRKHHEGLQIWKACLFGNLVTYLFITIAIYSYSF